MKRILAIILTAIGIDQLVKALIMAASPVGFHWAGAACDIYPPFCANGVVIHGADLAALPMTGWFKFVFVWNQGTSFSFFRGVPPLLLIFAIGIVIGFLCHYLFKKIKDRREQVAMSLIVGGALGNLIDRIRFRAVVDFLDFHLGNWHYPAFNVADICICTGIGLYILWWVISVSVSASVSGESK